MQWNRCGTERSRPRGRGGSGVLDRRQGEAAGPAERAVEEEHAVVGVNEPAVAEDADGAAGGQACTGGSWCGRGEGRGIDEDAERARHLIEVAPAGAAEEAADTGGEGADPEDEGSPEAGAEEEEDGKDRGGHGGRRFREQEGRDGDGDGRRIFAQAGDESGEAPGCGVEGEARPAGAVAASAVTPVGGAVGSRSAPSARRRPETRRPWGG